MQQSRILKPSTSSRPNPPPLLAARLGRLHVRRSATNAHGLEVRCWALALAGDGAFVGVGDPADQPKLGRVLDGVLAEPDAWSDPRRQSERCTGEDT